MSELNSIRETLESLRTTIASELGTIARQDTHGDWIAIPVGEMGDADENVTADTVEEWNERRATVADLEMRYHSINRALQKCAAGTYGTCEICSEKIEPSRLAVNPAARTCKIHLERERELPL